MNPLKLFRKRRQVYEKASLPQQKTKELKDPKVNSMQVTKENSDYEDIFLFI